MADLPATSSESCRVCDSSDAQNHFGTVCCKACAAFFRRYVNSKKVQSSCTCSKSKNRSFLCRKCRIEKCLAAGMNKCGVQTPRKFKKELEQPIDLPMTILSKDFDRIIQLKSVYKSYEDERKCLLEVTETPSKTNMQNLSTMWKNDYQIMCRLCEEGFPELKQLSESEKKLLFCNFYPNWAVLNLALGALEAGGDIWPYEPPPLDSFYEPDATGLRSASVSLKSVFMPYWEFFSSNLLKPIFDIKLEETEVIAIMALLLMDSGYSNLSKLPHGMCCNFTKVFKNQLAVYYRENEKPDERILKIMDVLLLIEKSEKKLHEEIQLCEVHRITIDKDFLEILNIAKL